MADFLRSLGLGWLLGGEGSASRIFISYRREDARGDAGRLTDDLKKAFGAGRVFRDIETIEPGVDFVEALNRAVSQCPVLLALIGPGWLTVKDASGRRRLDDPQDFIRLEIGTALARNIRVIPVLVGGAAIPRAEDLPENLQALARRQAYELSDRRWEFDVRQLIESLETIVGPAKGKDDGDKVKWWRGKHAGWAIAAAVVGLMAAIYSEFEGNNQIEPPPIPAPQPHVTPQPFVPGPQTPAPALSSYGLNAVGRFPTVVQVLNPG
jgi:hypothetical protein